jgi:hypothetical protein
MKLIPSGFSAALNRLAPITATPKTFPAIARFPLIVATCLAAAGTTLAQTVTLSNTWAQIASATPATNNLDTANDNRGLAFNSFSNQVLVNNKGAHSIFAYDATTGAVVGGVNSNGLSLGNFTLNKIGVAGDGILYGANLNTSVSSASAPYKLYSWSNYSQAPYNCFITSATDPIVTTLGTGKRLGDTFALRGSGTNTWILAGVGGTNAFALFSTSDGLNFTPTVVTIPGSQLAAPGSGVQFGLTFFTNNTFLLAPNGASALYLVQFPANFATMASPVTATVLATNTGLTGNFLDLSWNSTGLLATHANATAPITLYSLPANNFSALAQLGTTSLSFPTSVGANGNETGDIALGGVANSIYTLDTSAGVQATAISLSVSTSNTWAQIAAATPTTNNLDTANDNRGMAFNSFSNQVLVNNKGAHSIFAYDATTGAVVGGVNSNGLSLGNFTLNKIGVAGDGILYGANLNTSVSSASAPYKLYSWSNYSQAPYNCFITSATDPIVTTLGTGKRLGDTFAITGGGLGTMILAGVGGTNAFALFSTADGINFTPTVLTIPGSQLPAPGSGVEFGLTFFTNNTFLLAPNGGAGVLYLVQFPANFASLSSPVSATILATNTSLTGNFLDLAYNPASGLLATHANATSGIYLYNSPANNFSALAALASGSLSFPTSVGANGNETGDIAIGGPFPGTIFTLDTSAGLQATALVAPAAAAAGFDDVPGFSTSHLEGASSYNRGVAYSAVSNQVFVTSRTPAVIDIFDGTTGAFLGDLSTNSAINGGNITFDQVGVGNDGAIYSAWLNVSASSGVTITRWANSGAAPTVAFSGDPTFGLTTGKRVGDTMAVTGSGTNTLILMGVDSSTPSATTNVLLFNTTDGSNFTSTVLNIAGLPSSFGGGVFFGLAFYTNNTFLYAPNAGNLYLVQFPNPVAGQQSATANVLATNTFAPADVALAYNSNAGILAALSGFGGSSANATIYSLSNFNAGLTAVATTNLPTPNSNGNQTGSIAFGGSNLTNLFYALITDNGLFAQPFTISAGLPPTITTPPAGGIVYSTIPSFAFTVVASGAQPLAYQWQFNTVSNTATATNIAGATNATFTLNTPSTNWSGWFDVVLSNVAGKIVSAPVQLTVIAPTVSSVVTQLWTLAPGSRPYLSSNTYDSRGLAYDPHTQTVLITDKASGAFGIFVLNATNGADLFALNTLGIGTSGNIFPLDQVGVADDGVVYSGNLSTEIASLQSDFQLISWTSVSSNAQPALAFQGDPGNGSGDRWGDTMAVRGAGTNTQILLGSYAGFDGGPGTNASLLTTVDGVNFTPTKLTITNVSIPAGFSSLGIAFGASNTFWAKSPGSDLYQIAFDPASGNCSVLHDFSAANSGVSSFNSMSSIDLDVSNNILGGVTFNDVPNDFVLYQINSNTNPPSLFDQAFFPSLNGNSQENGVTTLKFPRAYALDVNNGIVALTYGIPSSTGGGFSILGVTKQAANVTLTWQSTAGLSYYVQYATALQSSNNLWTTIGGTNIATNSVDSYTDTTATSSARFYRVVQSSH